jgi:hypothetical protein
MIARQLSKLIRVCAWKCVGTPRVIAAARTRFLQEMVVLISCPGLRDAVPPRSFLGEVLDEIAGFDFELTAPRNFPDWF